jgi:hypothetical protein
MMGLRGCRLGTVHPEITAMQVRGVFLFWVWVIVRVACWCVLLSAMAGHSAPRDHCHGLGYWLYHSTAGTMCTCALRWVGVAFLCLVAHMAPCMLADERHDGPEFPSACTSQL